MASMRELHLRLPPDNRAQDSPFLCPLAMMTPAMTAIATILRLGVTARANSNAALTEINFRFRSLAFLLLRLFHQPAATTSVTNARGIASSIPLRKRSNSEREFGDFEREEGSHLLGFIQISTFVHLFDPVADRVGNPRGRSFNIPREIDTFPSCERYPPFRKRVIRRPRDPTVPSTFSPWFSRNLRLLRYTATASSRASESRGFAS